MGDCDCDWPFGHLVTKTSDKKWCHNCNSPMPIWHVYGFDGEEYLEARCRECGPFATLKYLISVRGKR